MNTDTTRTRTGICTGHAVSLPTIRTMIAVVSALALSVTACGGESDGAVDTTATLAEPAPPATEPPATEPPATEPVATQDVAVTAADLHGYWVNTAGFSSLFVDFRSDATFTIGGSGRLRSGAFTNGTFEATDATTVSFRTAGDASDCPGVTMTWTDVAIDNGAMTVEALAPDCEVPDATRWGWTRVSPASAASLELQAGDLDVERVPATETLAVEGLWLRVGTGDVLAIDQAGTYLLTSDGDSLEPIDSGTFVIDAAGVLAFTSDGSGDCDAGEAWAWPAVTTAQDLLRENQARGFTMRADSTELCGSVEGGNAWRLLSPEKT